MSSSLHIFEELGWCAKNLYKVLLTKHKNHKCLNEISNHNRHECQYYKQSGYVKWTTCKCYNLNMSECTRG